MPISMITTFAGGTSADFVTVVQPPFPAEYEEFVSPAPEAYKVREGVIRVKKPVREQGFPSEPTTEVESDSATLSPCALMPIDLDGPLQ